MSIRFRIQRRGHGIDCRVEAISQNTRHIEVEAQPGGNNGLHLKFSVVTDPAYRVRQNEVEQASEVSEVLHGIDDADGCQTVVYQTDRFSLGSFSSFTQQSLLSIDGAGTVTRLAAPAKQDAAA